MKKKQLEEIRKKTAEEIDKLAESKRKEIMQAKVDLVGGKLKNNRLVRNLRHELAQILTLRSETQEKKIKKNK